MKHAFIVILAFVDLTVATRPSAQDTTICAVVRQVTASSGDLSGVRTTKMDPREKSPYVIGFPEVWQVRIAPVASTAWVEATTQVAVPMWTSYTYVAILAEAGPAAIDAPRDPKLRAVYDPALEQLKSCLSDWAPVEPEKRSGSIMAAGFARNGWTVRLNERAHVNSQLNQRTRQFVELTISAPRPSATVLLETFNGEARGWLLVDPGTGSWRRPGDPADQFLEGRVRISSDELKGVSASVKNGRYILDLTRAQGSFTSTVPVRLDQSRGFTISATLAVRGASGELTWGGTKSSRHVLLVTGDGQVAYGSSVQGAYSGSQWIRLAHFSADRNVLVVKRAASQTELFVNADLVGTGGFEWFGDEVGFLVNKGTELVIDEVKITQP